MFLFSILNSDDTVLFVVYGLIQCLLWNVTISIQQMGKIEPEKSNFFLSHKVGRWRSWGFEFRSSKSRACAQKHYIPQPVSDSCSTLNFWLTFERKFKSSKKLTESSANFSFYSSLLYAYRLWTDLEVEMLVLQYFRLSQNKVRKSALLGSQSKLQVLVKWCLRS